MVSLEKRIGSDAIRETQIALISPWMKNGEFLHEFQINDGRLNLNLSVN